MTKTTGRLAASGEDAGAELLELVGFFAGAWMACGATAGRRLHWRGSRTRPIAAGRFLAMLALILSGETAGGCEVNA